VKRSRRNVRFNVNELREWDAESAAQVEAAIRSAVADLQATGQVECGVFAGFGRIHVRLDRPGWLGVFSVDADSMAADIREAAVSTLSSPPRSELLQ
jgi:hypothetical protein